MPFEERKQILESIKGVLRVEAVDDSDGTVCEALRRIKPTYFANGGDRTNNNTPEMDVCKETGIQLLWNIGGDTAFKYSCLFSPSSFNILDRFILRNIKMFFYYIYTI